MVSRYSCQEGNFISLVNPRAGVMAMFFLLCSTSCRKVHDLACPQTLHTAEGRTLLSRIITGTELLSGETSEVAELGKAENKFYRALKFAARV